LARDRCSFCGNPFPPNSPTAGGFDMHGNVVVAGECCVNRIAEIFATGLGLRLTGEARTGLGRLVDDTASTARFGGVSGANTVLRVTLQDTPWKEADRIWFEQNPSRSHYVRPPFPGEADKEVAETPHGYALLMLLRQVKPGNRIRAAVTLKVGLLPLPDSEAVIHALFEAAAGHEAMPSDRQAFLTLSEKYKGRQGQ
jgi:hypothetical protein